MYLLLYDMKPCRDTKICFLSDIYNECKLRVAQRVAVKLLIPEILINIRFKYAHLSRHTFTLLFRNLEKFYVVDKNKFP